LSGPAAILSPGAVVPALADSAVSIEKVVGPYMGVFFVAFFVSILATPAMRVLATKYGIVDWPDLWRKRHLRPVAYLGGVAIFLGWLAGVGLSPMVAPHSGININIVLGATVIMITGLIDDVYGIRARVKLGGQLFAAAALASERVGITLAEQTIALLGIEGVPPLLTYALGTCVIAIFVVGGCNAVNLLDGLDGLASGVTAIACIGFLMVTAWIMVTEGRLDATVDDSVRLVMCVAIIGAILGFLPYNFNPATIFMGDAGSLMLGFMGVTIILLLGKGVENPLRYVTACLIIFAVPITDTSLAIFRRQMRGKPIFAPDSQHLHHLLRQRGLTVRQSVLTLYGAATVFAVLGCSMIMLDLRWRYVLAVFFVMYGFILVTGYKYAEHCRIREQMNAAEKAESEVAVKAAERARDASADADQDHAAAGA